MSFLRRFLGRSDPQAEHEHEHVHLDEPVPGWDAITHALDPIYGDVEPLHWGTVVRWSAGGPDPLDGLSAYDAEGPPPHWHLVSYGLSELYRKESDDEAVSGWGIELTFRLARRPGETVVPAWALNLMQNLARYVFDSGRVLAPGDHMDLHGPIAIGQTTAIRAVALVEDPQLGTIATPHGSLTFSQIIGVTLDEYDAMRDWDTTAFLALVRERDPLLVTDLDRASWLEDDTFRAAVKERTRIEGSSMGEINVDEVAWSAAGDGLEIVLGALVIDGLHRMLAGRLPFGRGFVIRSESTSIVVDAHDELVWHDAGEGSVHLRIPLAVAERIQRTVPPVAGTYDVDDRLRFVVERTVIRDDSGAEVDVVG